MYAIGEIILVVIGILIALGINNNNEYKTTRKKEQTYLLGLRSEFQTSRLKLQELIRVNKSNYEGAKKIVEFISDKTTPPTEKQFSEVLFNTFAFDIAFNPNNSLLSEMTHSGSLKDILNLELRKRLTSWLSTLDDIAKQEKELAVQREHILDLFRSDAYSLRTILDQTEVSDKEIGLSQKTTTASNLQLLHSRAFENNILLFMLTSRATETAHYQPLLEDIDAILELINAEIKSN
ncbi:MAG: DUF6090 family protein [Saprospiraceae bacterium]